MRKFTCVLCVLIAILLVGCTAAKPESTVSAFIDAGKKFDTTKMAELVNPTASDGKGKLEDITIGNDEFEGQFQKYFYDYFKDNAAKITYTIGSVITEDNKATVTVDFKFVNGAPLMKATLGEYFTKAMATAFSGVEMSDEEMEQIFISAMKQQQQTIEESFVEKEIDIKLIKIDGDWYIDEPSDELLNVFTSNFVSVAKEIDQSMNFSDDDPEDLTFMEQAEKNNMTIITKGIGDVVVLATIKLKVNYVDEKHTITPEYGSPETAKDGAKFVLVNADVTNITKKPFALPPDLFIVDNKKREYKVSSGVFFLDDALDYKELSPDIKETGSWLYELPVDAVSYSLAIAKSGTNELYMIKLK